MYHRQRGHSIPRLGRNLAAGLFLMALAALGTGARSGEIRIKAAREMKKPVEPESQEMPQEKDAKKRTDPAAVPRRAWLEAREKHGGPGPVLLVTFPLPDRTLYAHEARYAGCSEPGARVSLNGRNLRLYPNGAFAGVFDLKPGRNTLTFVAVRGGAATSKRVEVIRSPSIDPLDRRKLRIATNRPIEPSGATELLAGDELAVQCQATPGARLWFQIGARKTEYPMRELDPAGAEAVRPGFYRGVYVVRPDDRFVEAPVRIYGAGADAAKNSAPQVRLRTSGGAGPPPGGVISALAPGRLSTGESRARRVARVLDDDTGLYSDSRCTERVTSALRHTRLRVSARRDDMFRVEVPGGAPLWVMRKSIRLYPRGTPPPERPTVELPELRIDSGRTREAVLAFPLKQSDGGSWPRPLPFLVESADEGATLSLTLWDALTSPSRLDCHQAPEDLEGHARRLSRHMRAQGVLRGVALCAPAPGVVRCDISLERPAVWGFDVSFSRGRCLLRVVAPPEPADDDKPLSGLHVFVDAGHGGRDWGAVGPAGLCESDVNLAISLRLAGLLQSGGARVTMARRSDRYVALDDRVARIEKSGADLMVSVHNNSIAETADPLGSQGPLTFYYHAHSRPLAADLFRALPGKRSGRSDSQGVRRQSFRLTRSVARMPAVLIEGLFMSHPEDEILLLDPAFLDTVGEAIYNGIVSRVRKP